MAILDNVGRTAKSVAEVPVDFAKAGVEMFVGENPLPKMKESVKRGLWDTVALGPRIVRDTTLGLLKGTLKLTWSAIKLLPLPIPIKEQWGRERAETTARVRDALELFKFDIDSKFVPNIGGNAPKRAASPAPQDTAPATLAA